MNCQEMEKTSRKPRRKEVDRSLQASFLKLLPQEEQITVERIRELLSLLKAKYSLSTQDLLQVFDDKEIFLPSAIFIKKLSILESVTKYLKEELKLSYHRIGLLLGRNERNIWHTYSNAKKKYPQALKVTPSRYFIPLSIFKNELSILENLVVYGKDHLQLTYHAIALLLERDDRTIWTMYQRAQRKLKKR